MIGEDDVELQRRTEGVEGPSEGRIVDSKIKRVFRNGRIELNGDSGLLRERSDQLTEIALVVVAGDGLLENRHG